MTDVEDEKEIKRLGKLIDRLTEDNAALVAALKKYGGHRSTCDYKYSCSCGLTQALASAEGRDK